jgi:hypothetical protein
LCSFAATLGFGVVFFVNATLLAIQAGLSALSAILRAESVSFKMDMLDDVQKLDVVFEEYQSISVYDDFVVQNPNRVILDDIETLSNPASNILRLQELIDIYLPYNESNVLLGEVIPIVDKILSLDFKTEYFKEFSEQIKEYKNNCFDLAEQLESYAETDFQKEIEKAFLNATNCIGLSLTIITFFTEPI